MHRSLRFSVILTVVFALRLGAQPNSARDSAAVVAAVETFHASLAAGDSAAVLALLFDGVQILEAGGVEDRSHYREHHLPGDIAYAKTAPSQRTVNRVTVHGDAAWVVSTSTATGEVNGRAVNSQGAELMVLIRTPRGWKIAAVHWSSRPRRA